ncbi:EamA family transporter [Mailhella sp.]|uniref:EamA family transporter n=1 Tax=Mailhella sp. TaxID=1981029 RepID=UPI003AB8E7AD
MGFFLALLSSAAFGLIPLFSLPLLRDGMSAECVLFYRFLFGALSLAVIVAFRHERLAASPKELVRLAAFSVMYALAALLMFRGFRYLPSGVASTLQFLYPLMVMLIMIFFFHEKPSLITVASVALAILGVFLLSGGEGEGAVSLTGIALLLVSALCNAVYICGLHVARIRSVSGLGITFWVLFFGMLASLANALASGSFQWLHSWTETGLAVLLAVVTAAVSNLALVLAIQRIGSTMASILGVMEPLTAVTVGILVFDEPATAGVFAGVAVICAAVVLVMTGPQILARLPHGFPLKRNDNRSL